MDNVEDELIGYRWGDEKQLEVLGWNGSRDKWRFKLYTVVCNKCREDKELHGGAIFSLSKSDIVSGFKPCGCGVGHKWTKHQYIVRINRECDRRGNIEFLGFSEEYRGSRTHIVLRCLKGGEVWSTVTVKNFLAGKGRSCCLLNGFDRFKPSVLYILKIKGIRSRFTGYGVSNNFSRRLSEHKRNLLSHGLKIEEYKTFSISGTEALRIENRLKYTFHPYKNDVEGFKTEATHYDRYDDVVAFVQNNMEYENVQAA